MKVFYSDEPLELLLTQPSIFLCGPTPRSKNVPSWRPDALTILEALNYQGQVCVPERKFSGAKVDYLDQVEWEHYGLENCQRLVFWVPRNMETMPALTTNVEFGRYVAKGNVFYGRPDDAVSIRYLDWLYKKYNVWGTIHNTLSGLLTDAIKNI